MRFDLTDLTLFQRICERGSMTAGAQDCHMTLASASERIRGMEALLGVALLTRQRRGVLATPAGLTLLHHARIVTRQIQQLHGDLQPYGHGLKGLVRLRCNGAAFSEYLPALLGDFLHRHRSLSIDLEEHPSHEVVDKLRQADCELGIVADTVDLRGLRQAPFHEDRLVLIVPQDHPLAAQRRIDFNATAGHDFVGMSHDSALHIHVAGQAQRQHGTLPNYRIRSRSLDAVCRMVGAGAGIAVVPHATAKRCARTAGLRIVALNDTWARRTLLLCSRADEALPQHAWLLAQHLVGVQADLSDWRGAAHG